MKPGDRLVCTFIEPLTAGEQFKEWPLHVTIVPWLRSELSSYKIAHDLEAYLQTIEPFEAIMGDYARFGKNKPVTLVALPSSFEDAEARVRRYFHEQSAWLVDETTKRQRPYRPHVTTQKSARLRAGDTFWCDRLYIIEQKGNYKEVTAVLPLRARLKQ